MKSNDVITLFVLTRQQKKCFLDDWYCPDVSVDDIHEFLNVFTLSGLRDLHCVMYITSSKFFNIHDSSLNCSAFQL